MAVFNLTINLDTFPLPRNSADDTPLVHADVAELLSNVARAVRAGHIGLTHYEIYNRTGVLVGNYVIAHNNGHDAAAHNPDTAPTSDTTSTYLSLTHDAPADDTTDNTAEAQTTNMLPPLTVSSDGITYMQASPTSRIKCNDAHIDEVLEWITGNTQRDVYTCRLCAHLRTNNSSAVCPRHMDTVRE